MHFYFWEDPYSQIVSNTFLKQETIYVIWMNIKFLAIYELLIFLFLFSPPTLSSAQFSPFRHHWCYQSSPAPPLNCWFLKYISIQINSYLPFLWPRILKESWGLILQEEFLSYLERNETSSPIHKTFPISNRTYHLITHSTLILHEFIV